MREKVRLVIMNGIVGTEIGLAGGSLLLWMLTDMPVFLFAFVVIFAAALVVAWAEGI